MTNNQLSISNDIGTKFESFFPNWITMLSTLLALCVLLFILTKFFYKPVKKMYLDRQKYIQDNIKSSEKKNILAAQNFQNSNLEILNAGENASNIIDQAKIKANQLYNDKLKETKKEINVLLENAQHIIEKNEKKFQKTSQKAVLETGLEIASKILEKEIKLEDHQKIIDNFLKNNKVKK